MNEKYTNEDLIELLEYLIGEAWNDHQMISYYYSGDKDTRREAFSSIMRSKNLPEYYEMESKDLRKYYDLYNDEIETEYHRLVEFGKEQMFEIETTIKYLERELDQLKKKMSKIICKIKISFVHL